MRGKEWEREMEEGEEKMLEKAMGEKPWVEELIERMWKALSGGFSL